MQTSASSRLPTSDDVGTDVNERLLKPGLYAAQMNWGGIKNRDGKDLGMGKELQGQELCRRKEAPDKLPAWR